MDQEFFWAFTSVCVSIFSNQCVCKRKERHDCSVDWHDVKVLSASLLYAKNGGRGQKSLKKSVRLHILTAPEAPDFKL